MASTKRFVANVFVSKYREDRYKDRTVEIGFDAAGSPRFPSFVLTAVQAARLIEDLKKILDSSV